MNDILVSISCITYNHAPYIRQCLEGFLMQKTNFAFEILIHDDASTDGTEMIVREYEKKYPDKILAIYENENQWVKGLRGSTAFNFPRVKGKYIALCEGDDFWTDPFKLQKQVDFMEANNNYALCFHATNCVRADEVQIVYNVIKKERHSYNICDFILGGGGFMATNSMLFRSEFINDIPQWMSKCPVGDLPLMLLLGAKGDAFYIDEVMSAYRVGTGGYTSKVGKDFKKIYKHYKAIYEMFAGFDEWTHGTYHDTILQRKKNLQKQYYVELVMCCMKNILGEQTFYKLHAFYKAK